MSDDSHERRKKYTISLGDDDAEVLDAVAHLAGYTGRAGAWIGDQVRALVVQRKSDPAVKQLIAARAEYRRSDAELLPPQGRMTRHGFGVIDGGVAS